MREVVKIDKNGGFLGLKVDGKLAGFCLVAWPDTALEKPQIMHFYSEAGHKETKKLVGYVLDTVKKRGYTSFIAVNGSNMPDDKWQRVFHHKDWEIKPVKTVFEFEAKQ